MEVFRTIVDIPVSKHKLDFQNDVLFMGSCFSENIGQKLQQSKFKTDINPFGILYNPASILQNFEILLSRKHFAMDDLFQYNDLWNSFYHHSRFSHADQETCLKQINDRIDKGIVTLANASFAFITFGTARLYENMETKHIVANCHKLPASHFRRYLLDVNSIVMDYRALFQKLKSRNPALQIVLTVSPIRHWKDGADKNQISKATLLLAVSELVQEFDYVSYFPAYEIMMDELRDYRFYADDMLHLSDPAIHYIWKRFCDTYLGKKTLDIINEYEKIYKAMQHRPFKTNTSTYIHFNNNMIKKIKAMQMNYPFLDMQSELEFFKKNIKQ